MSIADKLVLQRQPHLKWRWLDWLELALMILCGVLCFGFSLSVTADIVTRTIGHPWLWLQEVTSTLFIYAIFIGTAVATRRNDHLYLTAISESMHGASRLIVDPAPIVASLPIVTGATSEALEPMNAPSSITVRCLFTPS